MIFSSLIKNCCDNSWNQFFSAWHHSWMLLIFAWKLTLCRWLSFWLYHVFVLLSRHSFILLQRIFELWNWNLTLSLLMKKNILWYIWILFLIFMCEISKFDLKNLIFFDLNFVFIVINSETEIESHSKWSVTFSLFIEYLDWDLKFVKTFHDWIIEVTLRLSLINDHLWFELRSWFICDW